MRQPDSQLARRPRAADQPREVRDDRTRRLPTSLRLRILRFGLLDSSTRSRTVGVASIYGPRRRRSGVRCAPAGRPEDLSSLPLQRPAGRPRRAERSQRARRGRGRRDQHAPHRLGRLGSRDGSRPDRARAPEARCSGVTRAVRLAVARRPHRSAAAAVSFAAVGPRAPSPDRRQRPQVAPRARGLEGRRRAAEPRPRRRLDPPGRAHPRLRAPAAARPSPSARRDPGPGQHGGPADALPARVRPDRHGHLPRVVSARSARWGDEQSRLGRRRLGSRDRDGCRAEAVLDDACRSRGRASSAPSSVPPSSRAFRPRSRRGSWRFRRSSTAPAVSSSSAAT